MNPNPDNLPATTRTNSSVNALNQTQNFRPLPKQQAMARQLCLLVLDASGSMEGAHFGGHTKANAVNEATQGLINRLKISSQSANFQVGIINFDTRVIIRQQPLAIANVNPSTPALELTDLGHATDIGKALETAYEMSKAFLDNYQQGGPHHSVVIMILSDGLCHRSDATREIAERIKKAHKLNILKIATVLFQGSGEDEEDHETITASTLMQEVASVKQDGDKCFLKTSSVEALRQFFIASSGIIQP